MNPTYHLIAGAALLVLGLVAFGLHLVAKKHRTGPDLRDVDAGPGN
ncbi:MAG: hypothetical protein U0Q21_14790 [Dermatophilaceae bacterium]